MEAVKILAVRVNNRKREFVLETKRGTFGFPYGKSDPVPSAEDPVSETWIDPELASMALGYRLKSGAIGWVHVEQAFDYNEEPRYMRDLLVYRLSIEAQEALAQSPLAKREIIRRLGTSASQFYRMLDQTNYDKTVDSMLALLRVLDREVEVTVKVRGA